MAGRSTKTAGPIWLFFFFFMLGTFQISCVPNLNKFWDGSGVTHRVNPYGMTPRVEEAVNEFTFPTEDCASRIFFVKINTNWKKTQTTYMCLCLLYTNLHHFTMITRINPQKLIISFEFMSGLRSFSLYEHWKLRVIWAEHWLGFTIHVVQSVERRSSNP